VIYLDLPVDDADLRTAIDACQEHGCRLLMLNDRVERYTQALVPTIEDGHHFYTLQEEPLEDPLNRLLKRATDIAISLPVVLFVLPPLALLVAIGQRLQAPGPAAARASAPGHRGDARSAWPNSVPCGWPWPMIKPRRSRRRRTTRAFSRSAAGCAAVASMKCRNSGTC
jgi:hypothetical protein